MPFRDHLSAHEDAGLAGGHAAHHFLHVATPSDNVAIQSRESHAREEGGQRLLNSLGALSDGLHGEAALRATRWQRRVSPTVMTPQPCRGAVHGQPRVAIPAGSDPPARRAKQSGCVATAIQEHEHLTVFTQMPLDRLNRRSRDAGLHGARAQIDQTHAWRLGLRRPVLQRQTCVATTGDVVQRLERWCGRAQQHGHSGTLRAHDGQVPCRIPEASLMLFERGVVLFVDDYDA